MNFAKIITSSLHKTVSSKMLSSLPINELRSKLPKAEILRSGDDSYDQSVRRWNAATESRPGVVVRPQSTQDISTVLKFCKQHDVDVAVRGGGHFAGDIGTHSDELLLDLSSLNKVEVDATKQVAVVQGGALTGDIVRAADEHGLAPVVGSVSKVGFTGISTTGGYGQLTGQFGLMVDNILSAKIVLADGNIVTASPNENTDLFWALQGAGPHVGVVSELTVQLHKLHNNNQVLAGALMFEPDRADEVLHALNKILPDQSGRGTAQLVLVAPPPFLTLQVVVSVFYDGTDQEAKAFFAPLYDLKPRMDFSSIMPYTKATSLIDWTADPGQRHTMGHGVFHPPLAQSLLQDILQMYREFSQRAPETVTAEIVFEFHNLAQVAIVPENATAFPRRGLDQNVKVVVSHLREADDEIAKNFVRSVTQFTRSQLSAAGHEEDKAPGVYTGYDNHFTDTRNVFGKEKYDRLLAFKAKYDPDGVFNRWYPLAVKKS